MNARVGPRAAEAERVVGWIAVALSPLAAACLAVAAAFSPQAIAAGEHLRLLGVVPAACPGCVLCGLSRAFAWAIRGEAARAFDMNPLVLVCFPLALALAVAPLWLLSGRWRSP